MRSTPIKVLLISSQFPPTIGGGGTHTSHLAGELSINKLAKVCVLTSHISEYPKHEITKYGFEIYRSDFRHSAGLIYEPAIAKGLEICEKFKPDVIHGQHIDGAIVGSHLRSSYDIPLIVTIHKTPLLRFDNSIAKRNPIYSNLKLLAGLNCIDAFIAGSNVFKKEGLAFGIPEEKLKHIYHGIPYKYHQTLAYNDDRISQVKAKLNYNANDILIICPSRLDERKGLPILLKAIVNLQKRLDGRIVKLVITGEADKTEEIQLKDQLVKIATEGGIQENLQFCSFPYELLPSLFSISDVCVLPARKEGLGLVLLEGMSVKCPVIAANSPGIDEVIVSEENGLLFEPEDPADLTSQLLRIIVNDKLREKIKKQGLKTVKEKFAAKRMAIQHSELYEEIANVHTKSMVRTFELPFEQKN